MAQAAVRRREGVSAGGAQESADGFYVVVLHLDQFLKMVVVGIQCLLVQEVVFLQVVHITRYLVDVGADLLQGSACFVNRVK